MGRGALNGLRAYDYAIANENGVDVWIVLAEATP